MLCDSQLEVSVFNFSKLKLLKYILTVINRSRDSAVNFISSGKYLFAPLI